MTRSDLGVSCVMIAVLAGGVAGADSGVPVTPTVLEPTHATVNRAGHIYYNAISGERVVTLYSDGQTSPADGGVSVAVWSALVRNPCEAFGYTSEYFFGLDDATGGTTLSTGVTLLEMADIELDTVVDCIQVNWVVAHPDADLDSDGMVDGVEELAGQWVLYEPDLGRGSSCERLPLMDIVLFNLPGNTPENLSSGELTGWTLDVDLAAFGTATDLSFEIGDSDGDCQSAAFCNNDVDTDSDGIGDGVSVANADRNFDGLPDSDLDGDGFFDWTWSVRFIQPGQGNDFDSDSDTGSLPGSDSDTIGISFAVPAGSAVDNGDGTFSWDIDTSVADAGTGIEDLFGLYNPPNSTGEITYNGAYFFGGFACTGGLLSEGGSGYTPHSSFQFVLYGPSEGTDCQADMNGDGQLNFFDVSAFLQAYNGGDLGADFTGDGQLNFFDVSAFLQAYNAGCP